MKYLYEDAKEEPSTGSNWERKAQNFVFIIHLFTCAYNVWVISSPCPPPPPSPPLPCPFQAEPVMHFSPGPLKSRNKQ
jgi:hypothetical protein